ncbi:HisA/HisF-related TIM barrel protein [Cupriavidus necator]|uniref:HisA/HisF-related TIM barrel protein n=1 Tax=Cupriavidus necator TaxID=106590 RepID=UPI00339D864C
MHIVPVIDLLDAQVVRAVRGQRNQYLPIRSGLCAGSDPVTIARAMLGYCAARTLYIADLDALTGKPAQCDTLAALCHALPGVELWLDAGFADAADASGVLARLGASDGIDSTAARIRPVFGSESIRASAGEPLASPFLQLPQALLSLDRRHGSPLGQASWWQDNRDWPGSVIVMTLDRVGAFEGPDLALFEQVRRQAGPARQLIGAGGIRDGADLDAAARSGAHAWLVASAIHDLRIAPAAPADS